MQLHEYPRPANDTGIGIHWTVGYASAVGMAGIREFWIPEMKALGVKWVKIFNHDGALDFAELLLSEGLMPIVRIYRPSPNPSTLDVKEIVHLDALLRVGVRYFEFNSEPDVDSEWKGGRVPANGLDLMVDNTIANMETVLERGGMPAVPAVANGSRWDLVGRIVARGRRDLLDGPVWQALHNYSWNRPLDYPYDIGNQEGAAFTERFYRTVVAEPWSEDAWRGRTLQDVNRLRRDRRNPGATTMDDWSCWLAYEHFETLNRRHLGRSLPIISTENGYLIGEDLDARYPATTPNLHMAQTLEACRIMMGISHRYQPAPDYYFCTAFWLFANARLGSASDWWERHAWYSDRWPSGALPIVRALKAEPKAVRRWQGKDAVGARVTLRGTVSHAGNRRTIVLEKNSVECARTTLDTNNRYAIADLLPGRYLLRVEGAGIEQEVDLAPGQEEAMLNLDLSTYSAIRSDSVVSGRVRGGAGAVVVLLRASDGRDWVTVAHDDGAFRFVNLPAGVYHVRVQGEGSALENIQLDGKNRYEVDLAVAGWGYTIRTMEEEHALGAIRCAVEGRRGLVVQAHTEDWTSDPVQTGSAPFYGEYACEITPLDDGHYMLTVDGLTTDQGRPLQLEARVRVDKRRIPMVEFVYNDVTQPLRSHRSSIAGSVVGGVDRAARPVVVLIDTQANRQEHGLDADNRFIFENLAPGQYTLAVVGHEQSGARADVALDGQNQVEIELLLPLAPALDEDAAAALHQAGHSVIAGEAPGAAGRLVKLVDQIGNESKQIAGPNGRFRFELLPAGVYTLTVEGGFQQDDLLLDGEQALEVIFAPVVTQWEAKVTPAGSMPGYSVVRVEVQGRRDQPVHIWKEDWQGMTRRTGSKPEYGDYALEFSPLEPGLYMVEAEGLGVWIDVELTGLEVMWVDFHQRALPTRPTVVRPLGAEEPPDMPEEVVVWEAAQQDSSEQPSRSAEDAPHDGNQPAAPSPAPHAGDSYLFIDSPVSDTHDLLALLGFVARLQPSVGADVEKAACARRIFVLGEPAAVDEAVETHWRTQGIAVQRLPVAGLRDVLRGLAIDEADLS